MTERLGALDWSSVDFVVFDMDGTLLDLYFDDLVWNEHLPRRYAAKAGLSQDDARRAIRSAIEQTRGQLDFYCLDHWSAHFDVDVHEVEQDLAGFVNVRPGASDFLEWVGRAGLKRILATNAHPRSLARKLRITGIEADFEYIVSSHELGFAKEQAAFWHALAERTGLRPERTVFIDDNPAVLESAAAFGIRYLYGVARPNSRNPEIALAGYPCLRSFQELSAIEA